MKVKEVIYSEEKYLPEWPSDNAVEFLAWLQKKVSTVPVEYREEVKIDIQAARGCHDDYDIELSLFYYRPETEVEKENRLINERKVVYAHQQAELKQLQRLKEKYEGDNHGNDK